jgi:hypothetical protein
MNGNKKVILDKVEFEEKETPDNLEFTGSNFVLSSSQNMLGFDQDGRIEYQHHWPSPKISLGARIAIRTLQVALVAAASLNAMAQGATEGYKYSPTSISKQYAAQREFFEGMAQVLGDLAQRFKATSSRGIYSFILTDVGGGVGLYKVDKVSGKELGKIVLDDKEPVYDVDPENGMIFYKPSKKEVHGYTF